MSYLNNWKPSRPSFDEFPHRDTPLELYDLNFIFPVRELRSKKCLVRPFIPLLDAAEYLKMVNEDIDGIFPWFSVGPFNHLSQVLQFIETQRADPGTIFYAIYDLTQDPPQFAGTAKYTYVNPKALSAEFGHIILRPIFRRTHIFSHAVGLMLIYAFTLPNATHPLLSNPSTGGLGLRRLQWGADPTNYKSISAGTRMGFEHEGTLANIYPFPPALSPPRTNWIGKPKGSFEKEEERVGEYEEEIGIPKGSRGPSLHGWIGAITRGSWQSHVSALVEKAMAR